LRAFASRGFESHSISASSLCYDFEIAAGEMRSSRAPYRYCRNLRLDDPGIDALLGMTVPGAGAAGAMEWKFNDDVTKAWHFRYSDGGDDAQHRRKLDRRTENTGFLHDIRQR